MDTRFVYVVDDEEPIRRSACLLLKLSGFEATPFHGGAEFLDSHCSLDPGCVLLDLRMPQPDGLEVQRRLREQNSPHETVVMTGHGDVASAVAALDAGAVTFIEKPFAKAQLLPAIELALTKIDRPDQYRLRLEAARDQVDTLAPREKSVLSMLAKDHSSDQISSALQLSPAQIDASRAAILNQFGVDSIPAALTIAFAAARAG